MLFASLTFLLGFLPIAIVGTALAARFSGPRGAVAILTVASFVFYGWYHPPYVLLLIDTIALNFLLARSIYRTASKCLTVLAVTLNIALLAWFKYAGFLGNTVTTITGAEIDLPPIVLPLGISFFTFQQIAYLVDVHRGNAKPGAILDYVFLISFFPQLIAGPIVHHRQLVPQLGQSRFAGFQQDDVAAGTLLFTIGLAKKVLIADSLAPGADALFVAEGLGIDITMAEAWFGVLCYTFQIYFDFSGYSDMALGLGLILGLQLPVNFRSPYKSANIIDFWRRWNITLSTFLRDYVYFALGGNRRGPIRRYANLWIVMLLGGLWHGAGWQFVVWGGLHGFYLTVNHLWARHASIRLPPVFSRVLTFVCVVTAWVFFRAGDIGQALTIVGALVDFGASNAHAIEIFDEIDTRLLVLILAASLAWFAPNALEIRERVCDAPGPVHGRAITYQLGGMLAAAALITIYVSGNHAFIYFQF
ncbi:MAG: MBOAT family O-acyltransferase [Alphaproteobacteria bacterium]